MTSVLDISSAVILLAAALVLPGAAWVPVLRRDEPEGLIDRLMMAIGASIVIVPLTVFWLGLLFGVPVTRLSVGLITATLVIAPVGLRYAASRYSG